MPGLLQNAKVIYLKLNTNNSFIVLIFFILFFFNSNLYASEKCLDEIKLKLITKIFDGRDGTYILGDGTHLPMGSSIDKGEKYYIFTFFNETENSYMITKARFFNKKNQIVYFKDYDLVLKPFTKNGFMIKHPGSNFIGSIDTYDYLCKTISKNSSKGVFKNILGKILER
jgi:hypothetical protein